MTLGRHDKVIIKAQVGEQLKDLLEPAEKANLAANVARPNRAVRRQKKRKSEA